MNKPLITMTIACYNQEWCIRESLSAAFAQTYSPLEIVVIDDCSIDTTWEIVNEMTDCYNREDGRHKVILRRNPENSYRANRQVKEAISAANKELVHGEMIVQADGDDISLPNRVEEVYNAWENYGRVADLIYSGAYLINLTGKQIGIRSCNAHFSGSSMAYTARAENFFDRMTFEPLHGDDVRYYRAEMLGGVIRLDKSLVKYRVCGGYSQVHGEFRKPMVHNYKCIINCRRQLLLDVEKIKDVDRAKYEKKKEEFQRDLDARVKELPLWESDKFTERFSACLSMGLKRRFASGMIVYAPLLLLPHKIGDPILNVLHSMIEKWR